MSPIAPQFMFDFGSPNAFLSHEAIPAIEKRTGVKFEYVPILLGGIFKATNNKSPAESLAGIKNKREFHALGAGIIEMMDGEHGDSPSGPWPGGWSCQPGTGKSRCPGCAIYYPDIIDRTNLPG